MGYTSSTLTFDNIFTSEMWAPVVCFPRSFCGWIYVNILFLLCVPMRPIGADHCLCESQSLQCQALLMILYGCKCPFNLPLIICNLILYYFCSNDLPEADEHDITEEYKWIRTTLSASCSKHPRIQAADKWQYPYNGALTNMDNRYYSMLVSLRMAHQTPSKQPMVSAQRWLHLLKRSLK